MPTLPDTLFAAVVCDEFAAQVLIGYGISTRAQPFVVRSQSDESHKSVVWSVSPGAQELGIICGMPVFTVKRRYPGVTCIERRLDLELHACSELNAVLEGFSPDHAVRSTGKGVVDLTATPASRQLSWNTIGCEIKKKIASVTGLERVAVGIARTALIAVILAKQARPENVLLCPYGEELHFLSTLDCRLLPGLSPQCRAGLKKYGINQVCQVAAVGRAALVNRFGAEGDKLYAMASGVYEQEMHEDPGIFQVETVFQKDSNDSAALHEQLQYVVDKFCHQIKRCNLCIRQFTMVLRYSDNKRRQKTVRLPHETNDFSILMTMALRLFDELYERRIALRSVTVLARHTGQESGQLNLFDGERERKQQLLAEGIVTVRNRFQFRSVVRGATVGVSKT